MHPTIVHTFDLGARAAATEPPRDFQSFVAFTGTMSCHASVLAAGKSPHPPHVHEEEELLIPLEGEVELVLPDPVEWRPLRAPEPPVAEAATAPRTERVHPGSFAYYPAGQPHTIRNPGTAPATYLMFKWNVAKKETAAPLGTTIRRFADATATTNLLEGPTHALGRLHAHVSVVPAGGGYEAHADPYDVALVTLSGTIETLGRTVPPMSVVYCAAGDLHGLRNPGPEPARYLVFEFHAPGAALMPRRLPLQSRVYRFARRLLRGMVRRARRMAAASAR